MRIDPPPSAPMATGQRPEATAAAGPLELPPVVQRTLGDLTKKRVLHLRCGTGEATAALAELGAVATGVDARPAALETAAPEGGFLGWLDSVLSR